MRYRKLDANGDYSFGGGLGNFFIDQPEAVGQAVLTRLELRLGEWFLDPADGTAWDTEVLGYNTAGARDIVIQDRTLGTQGLLAITSYSSFINRNTRKFSVSETISTVYGTTPVITTF